MNNHRSKANLRLEKAFAKAVLGILLIKQEEKLLVNSLSFSVEKLKSKADCRHKWELERPRV